MEQSHQNLQSQFFIEHILQILPHRYPMLLVDRITELQANKKIAAYK
ncbi:3-hydroxyacyl-[acyl-carrier-protein] dehydratase FabZ, partial [Staphylococcus pseudintermedius]